MISSIRNYGITNNYSMSFGNAKCLKGLIARKNALLNQIKYYRNYLDKKYNGPKSVYDPYDEGKYIFELNRCKEELQEIEKEIAALTQKK